MKCALALQLIFHQNIIDIGVFITHMELNIAVAIQYHPDEHRI